MPTVLLWNISLSLYCYLEDLNQEPYVKSGSLQNGENINEII